MDTLIQIDLDVVLKNKRHMNYVVWQLCLCPRVQEKNNCITNNYQSTNLSREISLTYNPNALSTLTHTLQLLTLSELQNYFTCNFS